MNRLNHIRVVLALLFVGMLQYPSLLQIVHAADDHEHVVCADFTTHLHKTSTECELCDFHLNVFDYKFEQLEEPKIINTWSVAFFSTHDIFLATNSFARYLRGPPTLS